LRIQFQIMMFAIFFNIALFFIASTGFFIADNTFYGDAFVYDVDDPEFDINDPEKIPSADTLFTRLITDTATEKVANIYGFELTFPILMDSIVLISIVIGKVTGTSNGVSLLIVGLMFSLMWTNSKRVIDRLASGLDTSITYLTLMFFIGMLIMFVILIYDTSSGQKSTK